MRTASRPAVALILAALALAAACVTPPAPPLEPDDFTLAGVPLYSDSLEIRLTFGEPDSVSTTENPFAADVTMSVWHYSAFEVRFSADIAVGYMITAGDEATLRGIRIGDTAALVQRAYGEPDVRQPSRRTYVEADDEFGLRVVDFVIQDSVVTRIYLGAATP
jgi:hypothetical protein